jgi:hypothetical protein
MNVRRMGNKNCKVKNAKMKVVRRSFLGGKVGRSVDGKKEIIRTTNNKCDKYSEIEEKTN